MKVVVVGAGLGGCHAAAALAQRGCAVTVLERAGALGEAGAGVQISPNGARLLARIGALDAARAVSVAPPTAQMRLGVSGAPVLRMPLGAAAETRWGAPYLNAHRADLLEVLRATAVKAGAEIRTGAPVAGADDGGVTLADGGRVGADVVIAADGLRSTLRAALFGDPPARFTGAVAWRATVPSLEVPPDLAPDGACVWVGPGRHLVTYRLRGGALINIVAVEERARWAEEGWSQSGDPTELRAAFRGWRMAPLLAAVRTCWLWGLFERPAPPSWSKGRVALLGDACHPMPPFMAQGAVMAIEDGAALARLLPAAAAPAAALAAYGAARAARTARVQALARANARLFHARGIAERLLRYGVIAAGSRVAPGVATGRLDWLYGHVEPEA